MDNCGIYCIYFDQHPDKFYIGRSTNLYNRLQNHKSALISNRHINSKLQNYYNKYGMPNFEILKYASPEELNTLEEFYIKEFDSFNKGLNLTNGGENAGYGEGTSAAKHTEADYVEVLKLIANTNYTLKRISQITGVGLSIVKHIAIGRTHGYLANLYPEYYEILKSKINSRDNSAANKGIVYPNILSPEGTTYSISNIRAFCREHGLQAQNLHKVLTKQRGSHKGWRLA